MKAFNKTSHQFLMFAGIGLVGTSGHYAVLISMVQLLQVHPVIATTAGFAVGALINYALNYRITFNSNKRHREALTKFLLVAVVGAVLNASIMKTGVDHLKLHYLIIQLLATGVVLVFNFAANKHWTFADKQTN